MATLTNTKIKDTYDGLLKTTDNDVIGASEKVITDGLGNASVLSIGTASASFSSDIEVNTLTIGLGSGSIATNTALGLDALLSNTSGSGNVSVGQGSMRSNTIGLGNVSVGKDALRLNISGSNNTSLGYISLYSNTTGGNNTAVGSGALTDNTTGGSNVAMGKDALNSNTVGSSITAIGRASMSNATAGNNNTALGFYSLVDNQASNNVAVGDLALRYNTTGGANTALGSNALRDNTTGQSNTAIGKDSLSENTTGNYNASLGTNTLQSNTEGDSNVAVGYSALEDNTTGVRNIAIGHTALDSNTTGQDNVSIGHQSIFLNTTGNSNTAVGSFSLRNNTASGNTALGSYALNANISSSQNTAVGADALRENTASSNTALGYYSLGLNTTGAYNTAIGSGAGDTNTTGSSNVYIGYNAVGSAATNDNEIVIGASATGNGSNTATYGDSNITGHHFTAGQVNVTGNLAVDTNTLYVDAANNRVGIGTPSPLAKLHIASTNAAITDPLAVGNALRFTDNDSTQNNGQITGTIEWETKDADNAGIQAYITSISTNTGLGNLAFATGAGGSAAERMRIDSSGRVGIGISSGLTYPLTIQGATGVNNSYVHFVNATTGTAFSDGTQIGVPDGQSYFLINQREASDIRINTAGTERMRIDSSGNVGIGAVPNASRLLISKDNSTGNALEISNSGSSRSLDINHNADGTGTVDDIVRISNNGSRKFTIDSSGNVGIGGSSFGKLNVELAANSDGNLASWSSNQVVFARGGTSTSQGLGFSIDTSTGISTISSLTPSVAWQQLRLRALNITFYGGGGSESMRIDSSGNVGIGKSNPSGGYGKQLWISSLSGEAEGQLILEGSSGSTGQNVGTVVFVNNGNNVSVINGYTDSPNVANSGGLKFQTYYNGTISERMRIDSSGNVGIGVTPSSYNGVAGTKVLAIGGTTGNNGVNIVSGTTSTGSYMFSDSDGNDRGGLIYYHTADLMTIHTAGSERMRIDSSGRVGIGTSSPAYPLNIQSTLGLPILIERTNSRNAGIRFKDNLTTSVDSVNIKGDIDDFVITTGGSESMRIDSSGNVGIGISPSYRMHLHNPSTDVAATSDLAIGVTSNDNNTNPRALLKASKAGTNGGQLTFSTLSANVLSERMRITSSGSVLINTSDSTMQDNAGNIVTAGFKYSGSLGDFSVRDTANMIEFTRNSANYILTRGSSSSVYVVAGQSGGVRLSAGATSWTSLSDETKKENISELTDTLNKISNYRCVEYNLIEDESKGKKIGFIAQDWQNDYPQVVDTNEEGILSMKYTETIPVLLKAIQELNDKVVSLEERLNQYEAK